MRLSARFVSGHAFRHAGPLRPGVNRLQPLRPRDGPAAKAVRVARPRRCRSCDAPDTNRSPDLRNHSKLKNPRTGHRVYGQLGTASRYTRIGMLTHLRARAAPNTILRIVRNRFVLKTPASFTLATTWLPSSAHSPPAASAPAPRACGAMTS
jgi:hypothetical protein